MNIDPLKIKEKDLPLIVLSDDLRGFMGWAIKAHTHGAYNHAMLMIEPGTFVSQGGTYKKVPISTYTSGKHRLKFWTYPFSEDEKSMIRFQVKEDLAQNWWRKSYDWLGVIGQLLKIRKLNNPRKSYCSERVAKYMRLVSALKTFNPHPSPSGINRICKIIPQFKVFGHFFVD